MEAKSQFLLDGINTIGIWDRTMPRIIADIGEWRGRETELPEDHQWGLADLPIDTSEPSADHIRLALMRLRRKTIETVFFNGKADVTAIQALSDAAIQWCCEHSAAGLPEQAALWRMWDSAFDLLCGVIDGAVYSEAVAKELAIKSADRTEVGKCRLAVNLSHGHECIMLDGTTPYAVDEQAAIFIQALINAGPGRVMSGTDIEKVHPTFNCQKVARAKEKLPESIVALIGKKNATSGHFLKQEAWLS